MDNSLYLPDRRSWREWLAKHHRQAERIWLIYYKKHTGKPSIPYNDAVEEALCFGWIDSTVRRIDEERYMQQFTPRKKRSTWSKLNVKRVEKLIREGKMTDRGLAIYEYAKDHDLLPDMETGQREPMEAMFPEVPDYFEAALNSRPGAKKNFDALAPSYKLQYLAWIMSAKRPETREKRLQEAIERLSAGQKLGMK